MFNTQGLRAFAFLAGLLLLASAYGADAVKTNENGLAVGKEMPFHVVNFVNEKKESHGGCPSVMISNSGGRGVIVWSRDAGDAVFKLAKALDAAATDAEKMQRYLVIYDVEQPEFADKAKELKHVVVGKARKSAKQEFDGRGVDAKTAIVVFLLDKKEIKQMTPLRAEELSDAKIKELVAAAGKFAAGEDATAQKP
jgi:hypothetical protein